MRKKSHCSNSLQHNGFALVATISVMILLVMVALAMLSLATIEQKQSRSDHALAEARANARMSLMIAIGNLQMTAGKDTRVTASAALMDNNQSDATSVTGVANPYWVGVWESDDELKPPSYKSRKTDKFLRWLVSMRDNQQNLQLDIAKTAINDPITMVGDGSAGGTASSLQDGEVLAELITSHDDRHGFAWWVGDNSQKARINLPKIQDIDGDISWQQGINQSAPISGTKMTDSLEWLDTSEEAQQEEMQKVITAGTLNLHNSSPNKDRPGFHDFTTQSRTLPVDVMNGGYKWDLSRVFANEKLPQSFVDGGERVLIEKKSGKEFKKDIGKPLYQADSSHGNVPDWQRLADYHRFYQLVKWDGDKPYIIYDKETWMKLRSLTCSAPLPLVTRMQIFYSLAVGRYNRLALVLEPVVTFWNPYNVEIRVPKDEGQVVMRSMWQSIRIQIIRNSGRINATSYHRNLYYPAYPNTNMRFIMDGLTLAPGETKVCSDYAAQPFDWNGTGTTWGHNIYAQPGWENKGGLLGDGYGNFGTVSPGQTLQAIIEPWSSFHTEGSHWGQQGTNMWHQMDLIRKEPGLWSDDTFKSLQIFRVKDHDRSEIAKFWDFNGFTRNGISTSLLFGGEKVPLCMVDVAVRTETSGPFETLPYLFTSSSNGSFYSSANHTPMDLASTYWTARVKKVSDWDNNAVEIEPQTNRGFFGAGNTAGTGSNFVTMREVPSRPPLSLAAYRNFDILFSPETFRHWGSSSKIDPAYHASDPATNHVVSGSYAHPMLRRDDYKAAHSDPNVTGNIFDHAYLANHALYDKYFHSGLPTQDSLNTSAGISIDSVLAGDNHLPNPRFIWKHGIDRAKLSSAILDPETGHEMVAPNLYIAGGFNVNSTSLEAWRAFLGSMRKRKIPQYGVGMTREENASFPRQSIVREEEINNGTADKDTLWNGFQALDDDDIESLATAIVEQVKLRGPFHSMADFVNRRLSSKAEDSDARQGASQAFDLSRSGALQTAIDATDINSRHFKVGLSDQDVSGVGFRNKDAVVGLRGAGAPGYVMQGDLLQALGSAMTVRGDTFVIRAYGESRDVNGKVQARAWCEATVQRIHSYIDPTDEVEKRENLLPVNETFGRRFVLTNFRWLKPEEV